MSLPKSIANEIVERIRSAAAWNTQPSAVWFPDFERSELRANGLSALVMIPKLTRDRITRGRNGGDGEIHIAVMKPINAAESPWRDGEIVVDAADAVQSNLLGNSLAKLANVLSVDNEPVISAEYARQFHLWVSYLKCEFALQGA